MDLPIAQPKESIKSRYAQLEPIREPFLKRARACAKITIPTLLPESGHTSSSEFYTPFQGMGARGVNNIASKLLLNLFPTTGSCVRMVIDKEATGKAGVSDEQMAQFDEALRKYEDTITVEFEAQALRPVLFEELKHLIVTGNVCSFSPKDGGIKLYHLDRFVCVRDPMGNLVEIITKESVDPRALPEDQQELIKAKTADQPGKAVDIYTRVYLNHKGMFEVCQEICEIEIPDSKGLYKPDDLPFSCPRIIRVDGESYGRSYVEEYIGDLKSLEGLSQAIVEGSAAAAKVIILVRPNGGITIKQVANAANGAILPGEEGDVTFVQTQKSADLNIAAQTIERIEQRLAYAFLLNSAIQRSGERVTAEEIRFMAGEIEDALGGMYSLLGVELQLKLVKRIISQLESKGRLKKLPKKMVRPTIITGLDALGRGHEANKLQAWFGALANMVGPEAAAGICHVNELSRRLGTAHGVDLKGLVKTEEELAGEQQQAMMANFAEKLGPDVIKAGAASLTSGGGQNPMPSPTQG